MSHVFLNEKRGFTRALAGRRHETALQTVLAETHFETLNTENNQTESRILQSVRNNCIFFIRLHYFLSTFLGTFLNEQ